MRTLRSSMFLKNLIRRLGTQMHRILLALLFVLVAVCVAVGWWRFTTLEREIVRVEQELSMLQQSTAEAIAVQETLIASQGENLSKQDEALKQSREQDEALLKTIDQVKEAAAEQSAANLDPATLRNISRSIVYLSCNIDATGAKSRRGSGMLFYAPADAAHGPYYVQTSQHVVRTSDGSPSKCAITAYPDYRDNSTKIVFGSEGYDAYGDDIDFAYLTPLVVNGANGGTTADLSRNARSVSASPVCDATDTGDHLTILGYPAIGGDSLTITDGIISGFEIDEAVRYVKTSAKIDTGNSGGIAIKDSGCVVGIPTSVRKGQIESIGRVLDLRHLFATLGV